MLWWVPWKWVIGAGIVGAVIWWRHDIAGLVTGAGVGQWWPFVVIAGVVLVGYLWDVWRRPDVACWWCCGIGRVFGLSWLGRRVSGTCWGCRNERWRVRRVAKLLGWTRNSGVGW